MYSIYNLLLYFSEINTKCALLTYGCPTITPHKSNEDMKRYELTKEQWERVKVLLQPERAGKRGRPWKDDWNMLNGMLWLARSGAQWRELPEVYGPWQSVYARFAK